uniref:Mucin-19 n=1 Tax=Macrostomum lignano TaxID=282301 RepID=A0A1I8HC56_9PLAT
MMEQNQSVATLTTTTTTTAVSAPGSASSVQLSDAVSNVSTGLLAGDACVSPNGASAVNNGSESTLNTPDEAAQQQQEPTKLDLFGDYDDEEDSILVVDNENHEPPTKQITSRAQFIDVYIIYIGLGRWDVHVRLWFGKENIMRNAHCQFVESEYSDLDYLTTFMIDEVSVCSPEDRAELHRRLALAYAGHPTVFGYIQRYRQLCRKMGWPEPHKDYESAVQRAISRSLATDCGSGSGGGHNDDPAPATEQTTTTAATSSVAASAVTIANSTSGAAAHLQQQAVVAGIETAVAAAAAAQKSPTKEELPILETVDRADTADSEPAALGAPEAEEKAGTKAVQPESSAAVDWETDRQELQQLKDRLFDFSGLVLSVAPRPEVPPNPIHWGCSHDCRRYRHCRWHDRNDYLNKSYLPPYLISRCYHCREQSAKECGISAFMLWFLHLQHQIPYPYFLQQRLRYPPGRVGEAEIRYEMRHRGRQPCTCLRDRATGRPLVMPPCTEFPEDYLPDEEFAAQLARSFLGLIKTIRIIMMTLRRLLSDAGFSECCRPGMCHFRLGGAALPAIANASLLMPLMM